MNKLLVVSLLAFAPLSAHADVVLNAVFTDHMILQRDMPVPIYGTAEPGEKVTVAFAGKENSVVAAKDGNWSVKLDAMKVSTTPAVMTVTGKNKLTLNDILMGDIWICSGQSNMEWVLGACNRPDDLAQANVPMIRLYQMRGTAAPTPRTEFNCLPWTPCTPESVKNFPAVGYYFGRKVLQETGVPIGLIRSALGGSAIEPWTPYAELAMVPELAKDKEILDQQIKTYVDTLAALPLKATSYVSEARKALSSNTQLPEPPVLPVYPISNNPKRDWNCLYNGHIHALTRFAIKGVLWYQGEGNTTNAETYFAKKRALIGGWRRAWNQGDFPFYFVQLANYGNPDTIAGADDGGWAKLRMAQLNSLAIANTGMAVAMECTALPVITISIAILSSYFLGEMALPGGADLLLEERGEHQQRVGLQPGKRGGLVGCAVELQDEVRDGRLRQQRAQQVVLEPLEVALVGEAKRHRGVGMPLEAVGFLRPPRRRCRSCIHVSVHVSVSVSLASCSNGGGRRAAKTKNPHPSGGCGSENGSNLL
jgi:sialate O-acetylesterase